MQEDSDQPAGSDGGNGGDGDEGDAECEGSSDGAGATNLLRKIIRRAMGNHFSKKRHGTNILLPLHYNGTTSSILGRMSLRCCHSYRLFKSARAVWSKDVDLIMLKSDALMAEKSEEAELESVTKHASCKNKRLSTNVTNEQTEITRSFLGSLSESRVAGPARCCA